jgi:hypothetical protein
VKRGRGRPKTKMIRCCEEGYDKDEGDRQYDYGLNEVVGKDACRFVIS